MRRRLPPDLLHRGRPIRSQGFPLSKSSQRKHRARDGGSFISGGCRATMAIQCGSQTHTRPRRGDVALPRKLANGVLHQPEFACQVELARPYVSFAVFVIVVVVGLSLSLSLPRKFDGSDPQRNYRPPVGKVKSAFSRLSRRSQRLECLFVSLAPSASNSLTHFSFLLFLNLQIRRVFGQQDSHLVRQKDKAPARHILA